MPSGGPVFSVVSIKRSTATERLGNLRERPGGGFQLEVGAPSDVIASAYGISPSDTFGLPQWASSGLYDIIAQASVAQPTREQRRGMKRAMLADRFQLRAHYEMRERPSFDLVKARADGRLGPGMTPYDVDCPAVAIAESDAIDAGGPPTSTSPAQQCAIYVSATGVVGEMPTFLLASLLRPAAGRIVIDKTGLTATYRVRLEFEPSGVLRANALDAPPSVFVALQEQLGLKLEPSLTQVQVLVIDGIERPTDN